MSHIIKAIARIKQLEKKHKTLIANLKKYKNKVPVGKTNGKFIQNDCIKPAKRGRGD